MLSDILFFAGKVFEDMGAMTVVEVVEELGTNEVVIVEVVSTESHLDTLNGESTMIKT